MLWIALESCASGIDFTKPLPDKSIVAACLDEGDGRALLASVKLTNCYIDFIQRDATGAAVFFAFRDLADTNHHGVLVLRADGLKVITCAPETNYEHFFDDLKLSWFDQGDVTIFPSGDKLRWKSNTIRSAPGNELLLIREDTAVEQRVVQCRSPAKILFTVATKEIGVQSLFSGDNHIYLFGIKPGGGWVCRSYESDPDWSMKTEFAIPGVLRVIDFHTPSRSVLCIRAGTLRDIAGIFDLRSGKFRPIHLKVWRDHAFFLNADVLETARRLIK